jgi:hypothetical protein
MRKAGGLEPTMTTVINTILMLLLLIPAIASAGAGYDKCVSDESALREKEASNCSGYSMLFNPSGCYSVRKDLQEYDNGKCKRIGDKEGVRVVAPEQKAKGDIQKAVAANSTPDDASLKAENELLKAEIIRLRNEIEALKKTNK